MFCTNCGNQINDNEQSCSRCGKLRTGKRKITINLDQVSKPPVIEDHMVGAILATIFCCQVCGIVALVYGSQVSTRLSMGDVVGAREASESALKWIKWSIISFCFLAFLSLLCFIVAIAAAA